MANAKQLALLQQGAEVWNNWRVKNFGVRIELNKANLHGANLSGALLMLADLSEARLSGANLREANLSKAQLFRANLGRAILSRAYLSQANLSRADFREADLRAARLDEADLRDADLRDADLSAAHLTGSNFSRAMGDGTIFGNSDLSEVIGLEDVHHVGPSRISTDALVLSKGNIPDVFLRGCGLSDWEIESVKLYNPDLNNHEIDEILYRVHDLRASQSIQISPLFISYSHADREFVDKVGDSLTQRGIRYWRYERDMKSGLIETQIDRAMRLNPTVLLILSEHSIESDWVEHEVREARKLEKELGRDVLCPVALDDSWKSSPWPKRVMEQVIEYNILDFSSWNDDSKFGDMFRKLIDGLELFYKG